MRYLRQGFIISILITGVILQSIPALAYSEYASPLKISIGKDPEGHEVYLNKFSVVDVNKRIKRASHVVIIDDATKEYTSDYNCSEKTVHLIKVTIKEDNTTLEQKELNTKEKVTSNTIHGKLLEAVCRQNNSLPPPRRK